VDLLVSTLGEMECILGMEFITYQNVLIEGHNGLIKIPSKNGIVQVKTHEMPNGWADYPLNVRQKLGKKMHGRLWHVVHDVCVGRV